MTGDKINVGVVGCCGLHYKYHLDTAYKGSKNAKIFACSDLKINEFADKNIENKFNDFREMFRIQELDAVHIATNNYTHFDIAFATLENGLPTLLEKPMTLNYKKAKTLCKLSKKNKIPLLVGHVLRYDYKIELLKQMLENNELGKIRFIKTNRTGFKKCRPDCGEIFGDAVHDFDLCGWLLKKYPKKVQATHIYLQRKNIEDASLITLDFGSHLLAHIHVNNQAPNAEKSFLMVGEKKSVYIDFAKNNVKIFDTENATRIGKRFYATKVTTIEREEDMYTKEIDHFADCITKNKVPRIKPIEAAKAIRVAEKAVEAGYKEKWLNINY